jgi:hypothetical protein
MAETPVTRKQLIEKLNEDPLARVPGDTSPTSCTRKS